MIKDGDDPALCMQGGRWERQAVRAVLREVLYTRLHVLYIRSLDVDGRVGSGTFT